MLITSFLNVPPPLPKVAVVGSGIAGLTAAYLLRNRYQVTLFEADDRFGGHSHTHELDAGARGPRGVFAQPSSLRRPGYLRMLGEVKRFHRLARRLLAEGGPSYVTGPGGTPRPSRGR
jgi:uncharacterized protein